MFGNRTGWIISGVIVLGFVGLLYLMSSTQDPSPPTAKFAGDPKNLDAIQLPVAPETVVATMTEPGDAADKYRDAFEDVEAHPGDYKKYNSAKTPTLKGVVAIHEAGKLKEMHLFSKKPSEVMNYKADKDAILDLVQAGNATAQYGAVLRNDKKYDEALGYAEAVFSLGAKLYNERVIYEELDAGLGLMGAGSDLIASIAEKTGDAARVEQCAAFRAGKETYNKKYIFPLHTFMPAIDPKILATRAGDVFLVAQSSKERMWRSEAMLQLGRMRFNVGDTGRAADQHYAMRLLRAAADKKDEDPLVRAAAVMGRDLDLPTYNNQTASSRSN